MLSEWQDNIVGYSEECLTPHMKILILKWEKITKYMRRKNRVDKDGVVWCTVGYLAKCCGHGSRATMQRTLTQMSSARYISKVYKNRGTQAQMLGIRMNECVYRCEFSPLTHRNKSRNQKNFFCLDCGSRDVTVEPQIYLVMCKDCGSVHYQTEKGKPAGKPRKDIAE